MYLTWFDNNSWLIEMGGQRILLDPWLVGSLVFGHMPWLFNGNHTALRSIPEQIDLILLSQGLEDHAHPPTLEQLDRTIPVVASLNAAKVVHKLGYSQITPLAHGESFTIDRLKIQAVPGSPIGPFLTENGYFLTDLEQNTTLYYEPHGYHSSDLKTMAPVDVVITPVVDLRIPLLGAIIQGNTTGLQAVEWLKPQAIVPTAAGGDVTFEGLLNTVLQAEGSVEEFRAKLTQHHLPTRLIAPKPGERFEVELVH
ncbi:MAG: MBL fold metallo-hydrolase [Cyanobacteria bacterium CRU_2_1]|nr:MBL fold metallo-hydrolase [Cyanobacteria bacterium RU_5_0]NJR62279.1 MBL fold metallo-hydrolase [Cyanobacteria bacterium CRU_2_1]